MLQHASNLFYYLLNKTLDDSKTPVIRRVIDGTEECIAKDDDDDLFIEEQSFVTKIFVQASFFELFRNRNLVFFSSKAHFSNIPIFKISLSLF